MSQDEQPDDEHLAAFEALGGQLTWDELVRVLDRGKYQTALVQHVALLLAGDIPAAEQVVRESFAALRERGPDPQEARILLYRAILNKARSMLRSAAPGRAGQGVLPTLPQRQREVFVLCRYAGLPLSQAASAMGISIGAAESHLARAMSSFGE